MPETGIIMIEFLLLKSVFFGEKINIFRPFAMVEDIVAIQFQQLFMAYTVLMLVLVLVTTGSSGRT